MPRSGKRPGAGRAESPPWPPSPTLPSLRIGACPRAQRRRSRERGASPAINYQLPTIHCPQCTDNQRKPPPPNARTGTFFRTIRPALQHGPRLLSKCKAAWWYNSPA